MVQFSIYVTLSSFKWIDTACMYKDNLLLLEWLTLGGERVHAQILLELSFFILEKLVDHTTATGVEQLKECACLKTLIISMTLQDFQYQVTYTVLNMNSLQAVVHMQTSSTIMCHVPSATFQQDHQLSWSLLNLSAPHLGPVNIMAI